jgi:ABC-type Fe3+ transport system permease subunit
MNRSFYFWVEKIMQNQREYRAIKNNPEQKATCTKYGKASCLFALFFCITVALAYLGFSSLIKSDNIFAIIGIILLSFVSVSIAFILPIFGIVYALRQINLDKKAGGIIGLILNTIMLAVVAALIATSSLF